MFVSISLVNPGFPEGCYNLPISNHTGLTLTIHIVSPDANFCCCYYQKWNQVKLLVFSSWQKIMVWRGVCVLFFPLLLLVGILLLQWSDSNGFVLKGMWKEVRVGMFFIHPKIQAMHRGLRERRCSILIWYNLLRVRHMVLGGTPTDLHPKLWFCVVKALNTLIKVHSAAKFCKKTQNWLTQLEQLPRSTEANPGLLPSSLWDQPLGFLQDPINSPGWTMKKGPNLPLQHPQNLHHPAMGTGEHRTLGLQSQTPSAWQQKEGCLLLTVLAGPTGTQSLGGCRMRRRRGRFSRHHGLALRDVGQRAQQAEYKELLSPMDRELGPHRWGTLAKSTRLFLFHLFFPSLLIN